MCLIVYCHQFQKADDKVYVCKISRNVLFKLFLIENSNTTMKTVWTQMRWLIVSHLIWIYTACNATLFLRAQMNVQCFIRTIENSNTRMQTVDPDEVAHCEPPHLDLHCLPCNFVFTGSNECPVIICPTNKLCRGEYSFHLFSAFNFGYL